MLSVAAFHGDWREASKLPSLLPLYKIVEVTEAVFDSVSGCKMATAAIKVRIMPVPVASILYLRRDMQSNPELISAAPKPSRE